jgi:hypothetical protein
MKAEIVDELSKINLDDFQPLQGIEMLAPKSRYGLGSLTNSHSWKRFSLRRLKRTGEQHLQRIQSARSANGSCARR